MGMKFALCSNMVKKICLYWTIENWHEKYDLQSDFIISILERSVKANEAIIYWCNSCSLNHSFHLKPL